MTKYHGVNELFFWLTLSMSSFAIGWPPYTYSPSPLSTIPDNPYGQLTDKIWASAGATYYCDEAVGFLSDPATRDVTIWFDLGAPMSLEQCTVSYWSRTNNNISGPTFIRYWFSSADTPNITDPASTDGWSGQLYGDIQDGPQLPYSASTLTHFDHTTDLSSAGSARWIRMQIWVQNAEYGPRVLSMDEIVLNANDRIIITQQPLDVVANVGTNPNFTVAAFGTELNYQWKKNGEDLPDENSPVLQLYNVQKSDSGSVYNCEIFNAQNSVETDGSLLTVNCWYDIAADFNDDCVVNLLDFAMLAEKWLTGYGD